MQFLDAHFSRHIFPMHVLPVHIFPVDVFLTFIFLMHIFSMHSSPTPGSLTLISLDMHRGNWDSYLVQYLEVSKYKSIPMSIFPLTYNPLATLLLFLLSSTCAHFFQRSSPPNVGVLNVVTPLPLFFLPPMCEYNFQRSFSRHKRVFLSSGVHPPCQPNCDCPTCEPLFRLGVVGQKDTPALAVVPAPVPALVLVPIPDQAAAPAPAPALAHPQPITKYDCHVRLITEHQVMYCIDVIKACRSEPVYWTICTSP